MGLLKLVTKEKKVEKKEVLSEEEFRKQLVERTKKIQ